MSAASSLVSAVTVMPLRGSALVLPLPGVMDSCTDVDAGVLLPAGWPEAPLPGPLFPDWQAAASSPAVQASTTGMSLGRPDRT